MSKAACAIVIVVYKQSLTEMEVISFKQCLAILGKHPIALVAPQALPVQLYLDLAKGCAPNLSLEIVRLPDRHFLSLTAYNKLLLSKTLYALFSAYDYVLMYQLDAFVFSDDLLQWCAKGYDYVGAPWFEGRGLATEKSKILPDAGNGGFSLRRVSSLLRVLDTASLEHVLNITDIWRHYENTSFPHKLLRLPKMTVRRWSKANRSRYFYQDCLARGEQEDVFFGRYAPKIDSGFRVAAPDIAKFFSFECLPRRLYEMTSHRLPFGCHAWDKYDLDVWRPFIEKYGHRLQ